MTHPLVTQLRFARGELQRALEGLTDEEARRRLKPMNCISWMIGHLANQENRYWVLAAQGKTLFPELHELVGFGKPASTPPLDEMWEIWRTVTAAADVYLDTVTPEILQTRFEWQGKPHPESVGTLLQRALYHYWYHIGEAMAVRQMLGHANLPEFVGDIGAKAPYRPES
ncbi:MAG: DinB family protein [Anaerolineae bacterium]|nr:DinB family protein [Anaerolineae bacterium]